MDDPRKYIEISKISSMSEIPNLNEMKDICLFNRYWLPEVLLLGPGGTKGFIELGPILYFEQIHFLDNVHTVIGVSVGSIITLFLAARFTVTEIIEMSININILDELMDREKTLNLTGLLTKLKEVAEGAGLLTGRVISNLIKIQLEKKWGKIGSEMTMKNLYDCTGIRFIATVTNCSTRTAEYLDYANSPDLPVIDAVLMSAAIPGLFGRKSYRGMDYQDGAFSNPYPVDLLDDGKTNILGIYVESIMHHAALNPLLSIYNCINIHMRLHKRLIEKHCSDRVKSLEIETDVKDFIGLTLTNDDRNKMILNGWREGKRFYENLRGIVNQPIRVPYSISLSDFVTKLIEEIEE